MLRKNNSASKYLEISAIEKIQHILNDPIRIAQHVQHPGLTWGMAASQALATKARNRSAHAPTSPAP